MGTVSKLTAIAIAANYGTYLGDSQKVIKIVKYNNCFDGDVAYAIVYEGQDRNMYEKSPACHNVKTIWTYEDDLIGEW